MFNTQSGHSRAQQGGGPRHTNGDIYFEKLTFIFVLGWAVFLFMVGFIIYKGRSLTAICGRQGSQNHTACDPKQNCFLLQIWKWRAGPAVAAAADTVVSDGGGGGNTKLYRTKKNHSHWHFRKVKILVLMFYNEHITDLKLQMLIIFAHCRKWKTVRWKKGRESLQPAVGILSAGDKTKDKLTSRAGTVARDQVTI